jgi:hypothetical protein
VFPLLLLPLLLPPVLRMEPPRPAHRLRRPQVGDLRGELRHSFHKYNRRPRPVQDSLLRVHSVGMPMAPTNEKKCQNQPSNVATNVCFRIRSHAGQIKLHLREGYDRILRRRDHHLRLVRGQRCCAHSVHTGKFSEERRGQYGEISSMCEFLHCIYSAVRSVAPIRRYSNMRLLTGSGRM